jgi:hypothetical protein
MASRVMKNVSPERECFTTRASYIVVTSQKGNNSEKTQFTSTTKIELEPYEAAICSHTLAQQGRLGQVKQLSVC